ncbi:MAG: hypothetical protein ACKOEX_07960 [Planctomycetia bacterium]
MSSVVSGFMSRSLSHLIVVLTALSTVLAGVPARAVPDDIVATSIVSPLEQDHDDDANEPRGEQDSEESEEENELEVKLFAERETACGPRCDMIASIEPPDHPVARHDAGPAAIIRGPPRTA